MTFQVTTGFDTIYYVYVIIGLENKTSYVKSPVYKVYPVVVTDSVIPVVVIVVVEEPLPDPDN